MDTEALRRSSDFAFIKPASSSAAWRLRWQPLMLFGPQSHTKKAILIRAARVAIEEANRLMCSRVKCPGPAKFSTFAFSPLAGTERGVATIPGHKLLCVSQPAASFDFIGLQPVKKSHSGLAAEPVHDGVQRADLVREETLQMGS